jgi:hypothetical protein
MPLIIPNAGDTTGGSRFEALDQAEPSVLVRSCSTASPMR